MPDMFEANDSMEFVSDVACSSTAIARWSPVALSVVIPVRNEAPNVGPLFEEIRAALDGRIDYEVIYVDDDSDDDTVARLSALAVSFPQLRTIRHSRTCGQSTAVRSGVRAARHEWIATVDGDGQNDPMDIPRLLKALSDSPHSVRLIGGYRKNRRDTALKRLSSRVANRVRSTLLRDNTPDTGCGLKLFQREAFLELPYFDHMHRFLPALMHRAGWETRSVEVNHRPRLRGRSNYGLHNRLWVGIVDLFGVMWLMRRARIPQLRDTSDTNDRL